MLHKYSITISFFKCVCFTRKYLSNVSDLQERHQSFFWEMCHTLPKQIHMGLERAWNGISNFVLEMEVI